MIHWVQILAWPVAFVCASANIRRAIAALALSKYDNGRDKILNVLK